MRSLVLLACAAPLSIAMVVAQSPRVPVSAGLAQQIVGVWTLESRTVTRQDGSAVPDPVLGEKPTGRLFYDATGLMMLQMMRQGRTSAISAPASSTANGAPRIALGYDAYFGRYTVDERAGTVTHHVEGSLFPEDLGGKWVRPITVQGDTLTIRFTSTADGASLTRTLTFRRAK